MDEIRRHYDVNVFGVMAVTKAVLPIMRGQRSGKIIITTSAAGRMGTMSIGGYCSGKFALEGMAECLRQEMAPFNVHVSCIEPGLVATPHFTVHRNRGRRAVDPSSPYYLWFCQHEKIVDDIMARNKWGVEEVAATALRVLRSRRPPLHNIVGFKAKLLINLKRYSPFEWFETWYWGVVRKLVTRPKVQCTTLSGLEHQFSGLAPAAGAAPAVRQGQ
jgi:NAD(P)-dependent dehydrogenase (short-subunit alcohol dehydrogenase family)